MMRSYATVPIRVSPSQTVRQPRTIQCRIAGQRGLLVRLQRWVLGIDWEARLCRAWVDKACRQLIAASVGYFALLSLSRLWS